jgi:hypothetical protein
MHIKVIVRVLVSLSARQILYLRYSVCAYLRYLPYLSMQRSKNTAIPYLSTVLVYLRYLNYPAIENAFTEVSREVPPYTVTLGGRPKRRCRGPPSSISVIT